MLTCVGKFGRNSSSHTQSPPLTSPSLPTSTLCSRLRSLKLSQMGLGSLLRSLPHRQLWMTLQGASGDPSWISLLGVILCPP